MLICWLIYLFFLNPFELFFLLVPCLITSGSAGLALNDFSLSASPLVIVVLFPLSHGLSIVVLLILPFSTLLGRSPSRALLGSVNLSLVSWSEHVKWALAGSVN